jgi:type III pantothenate kinase
MCKYYFNVTPLFVGPGVKSSLNVKYDSPKDVGSDRIVNCVAAYRLYGGPCIVVDFGTTTTFNVVSEDGEFLGGAICPGIKTSVDAMVSKAAKLPKIELKKPNGVIGKSTVTNMQSGIIYGFTGMITYIINKMKQELGREDAKVIATGGLSELIFSENRVFDITDRTLTLHGLKFIFNYNKT